MVERIVVDELSELLKAASDPTRRAILTLLAQNGPMRVTDIHTQFEMSLNSVSKHIKVLEKAGLIRREVRWRKHICHLNPGPLASAHAWLEHYRAFWTTRLDSLESLLRDEAKNNPTNEEDK